MSMLPAISKYRDAPRQSRGGLKAWVVFSGQADLSILKFLRKGFRHCALILNDGTSWVFYDPMLHFTDIHIQHHIPLSFFLPNWYRRLGYTVIEAPVLRSGVKPAPIMPISCVESIKRILGYHDIRIFTPWNLYCRIQSYNKSLEAQIDQKISNHIFKKEKKYG